MIRRPIKNCLIKDKLGRYCLQTFETVKGKIDGATGSCQQQPVKGFQTEMAQIVKRQSV